ncbi:ribosomal protein S5 domain 2-type protein [Geranomyces variabilis]|nr:ribosomal protein S5 domain 2-type protein [Geranomyces variabilis]
MQRALATAAATASARKPCLHSSVLRLAPLPITVLRPSHARTYAFPTSSSTSTSSTFRPNPAYDDILASPHPAPRPESLAYFTGNPRYFAAITTLNALIRKHGLNFRDTEQYAHVQHKPKWMTMDEMAKYLEFRLVKGTYEELVHKLNMLFAVQAMDGAIATTLQTFVKPGATLVTPSRPTAALDEFGRSYSYGSRKTAKAQAWIIAGTGLVYVNGVHMSEHFAQAEDLETILRPLVLAGGVAKYNVWALVRGGGQSGQAAAVAVAVARGLCVHEPPLAPIFKDEGLVVIDTRQVERKKTGQPGARKKNTWYVDDATAVGHSILITCCFLSLRVKR